MKLTEYGKEILKDKTQSKNNNMKSYMFLKELKAQGKINITDKSLKRIHDCGKTLKLAYNNKKKKHKILYTERCHSRFCENCQKSSAITDGVKIYTVANYLRQTKKYQFVFVTLTVKNVKSKNLKDEVRKINQSVDKMFNRKAFKKEIFKGYITKMEITYNRKRYDYHPHLHLLIAVDKNYFSGKDYLTRDKLLSEWKTAFQDDEISQVHIEKVNDFEKSILEISKYEAKSNDMLVNKKVFETYYNALSGSKMLRFNREFKLPALAYDNDKYGLFEKFEMESDKVIDYENKLIAAWIYQNKKYQANVNELTEAELKYLLDQNNFLGYEDFKIRWNKVIETKNELLPALQRYEVALQNTEDVGIVDFLKKKLAKQKTKISNLNLLITIYEFIDTEMKTYFRK